MRWHIPAADRRAWLCLATENPDLLSSTTSSSPSSTGSPTSSRVDHEDVLDTALLVPSIENKIDIRHNTGFVPQAPRRLY